VKILGIFIIMVFFSHKYLYHNPTTCFFLFCCLRIIFVCFRMKSKRVFAELKNQIHRKCGWLCPNTTWVDSRNSKKNPKFRYITSCLDRTGCVGNKVKGVRFCISRDWSVWHTLRFRRPLTRMEAVMQAERYLSEPLDRAYFQRIETHSFMYKNWKEARELYTTRGDALSDAKFLEVLTVFSGKILHIECGS
jgi:hypothetical protein